MTPKSDFENSSSGLSPEEKWVIDLLNGEKGGSMPAKYITSSWELEFSDSEMPRLRAAIASLRQKGKVKVANNGVLSLSDAPRGN